MTRGLRSFLFLLGLLAATSIATACATSPTDITQADTAEMESPEDGYNNNN